MLQKVKRPSRRKPVTATGLSSDLVVTIRALLDAGLWIGQIERSDGGSFKVTTTAAPSDYLSVPDATAYAGLQRSRIYELVKAGKVTQMQLGGRKVILKSSIDQYLKPTPVSARPQRKHKKR